MKLTVVARITLIFFVSLLLHSAVLSAAAATPQRTVMNVEANAPHYPRMSNVKLRMGTYYYDIGWEAVPAGTAVITMKDGGDVVHVDAVVKTASWMKWFYKLTYRMSGRVEKATLRPITTTIRKNENGRKSVIDIHYDKFGNISSSRWKYDRRDKVYHFKPESHTLEPIAGIMYARSIGYNIGEQRQFDLYNGRDRYLIDLNTERLETVSMEERPVEALVLRPRRVTDLVKNEPAKKLRDAFIYITNDEYREVAKIESDVFVGSVTAELRKFEPFPQQPPVVLAEAPPKTTAVAAKKVVKTPPAVPTVVDAWRMPIITFTRPDNF